MERKIQKGFQGEKIISLPRQLLADYHEKFPSLFHLYITHIGYFPNARSHFRERPSGCSDNIIFYCTQGVGWIIVGERKIILEANQFYILQATKSYICYGADRLSPWTIYWVHYKGEELSDFNSALKFKLSGEPRTIPYDPLLVSSWEHMYNCLELGYSMDNLCNANFSLFQFLAKLLFNNPVKPNPEDSQQHFSEDSIRYMKDNIYKRITVEELAKRALLSNSYFSNLFRDHTGIPPMDYFIHLKMQKACQLLFLNQNTIKEIAVILGYTDPFYFSRLFKRYMGSSPLQYRNNTKIMPVLEP